MKSYLAVLIAVSATSVLAGPLGIRLAMAQAPQSPLAQAVQSGQAPYAVQYDGRVTVRADRTSTDTFTHRIKILTPGAIATVSQQQLTFVEGMQTLETVEAFTEKSDGTKVSVGPANIMTRDAASGLQAVYMRDLKQRTVIFQDVQVGDTLVMTHRKETKQSIFPGHFLYADVFPRSRPFTSAQIIVEAPNELNLEVKAIGTGLTDKVEDSDGVRRHTATLLPQPYLPEEVRAVAPVDRDPALLVSTFGSYEEMGLAYAAAAFPKSVVTPEIAALADDITKGIDDRRQQAVAIDEWVKKNIRYVAVYLALGRVVPNDAASVLSNKFGDCKDKATLMSALLAAKGIASEAVLINFGGAYTLPEPPTMVALNHVILYLPEFDLYDDPTQNFAAFGVLTAATYDKPVVRVGANGVTLGRTPVMDPKDHTSHATTILNVAADGTVTGQTEESTNGIFGITLRFAGSNVQNLGHEAASQRQLQGFNTPGTGRYDLGNSAEKTDPVTMKSTFTLSQRFTAPAAGARTNISFGLPQVVRPGNFLLGTRLNGRKSAFSCYAGRQTEDIDATFDQSLPMPIPLAPVTINNPAFTYLANFRIEGRTLRMHREFVSRVAGQVCSPELEAQISNDMNAVRINVYSSYSFRGIQGAQQTLERTRVVASDQKLRLDFLYSVNPDCTSMGFATVRIIEQPKHGRITAENGTGFTNFPQNNQRYECNKKRSDGVIVVYEPDSGFTGTDSVNIDAIFPTGTSSKRHYSIEVK
jgi:Domain of Unknown Function with PDB structure (DUF3857)/Transglutaminase-like superfamily